MMKGQPNPQFFSKFNEDIFRNKEKQTKEVSQINKNNQKQNNLFDFGLSDDDWNSFKKKSASQIKINSKQQNQFTHFNTQKSQNDFKQFDMSPPSKPTIQQKKLKLQELYKHSKQKSTKMQKQQSQLEQIIKYNQASSASKLTIKHNRNENNSEQDFFNIADQQNNQQQDFSVFDKVNAFNSSQKKSLQSSEIKNKYLENHQNQIQTLQNKNNQTSYFQTQSLLQSSNNDKKQSQKIFVKKCLSTKVCVIKLIIHLLSVTLISILYGFMSSIIVLILHDFIQFGFILIEMLWNNQNLFFNSAQKSSNKQLSLNTRSITLSMSDQLNQQNNSQKTIHNYASQQINIKRLIKFYTSFKYSLYVSSVSLSCFIIVHMTQIDTFFTVHLFSFYNWSSIIVLALILIVQGLCNYSIGKKIDQILFYQNNVLQDIQKLNEERKLNHQIQPLNQNDWD